MFFHPLNHDVKVKLFQRDEFTKYAGGLIVLTTITLLLLFEIFFFRLPTDFMVKLDIANIDPCLYRISKSFGSLKNKIYPAIEPETSRSYQLENSTDYKRMNLSHL